MKWAFLRIKLLDNLNVFGLRTFLAFSCDKRNALVFFKRFMTSALNFAVMCEKVFTTGFRHDEAEPFVVVKPFHNTNFCFQCKS